MSNNSVRVLIANEAFAQLLSLPSGHTIEDVKWNQINGSTEVTIRADMFPVVAEGQSPPLVGINISVDGTGKRTTKFEFNTTE